MVSSVRNTLSLAYKRLASHCFAWSTIKIHHKCPKGLKHPKKHLKPHQTTHQTNNHQNPNIPNQPPLLPHQNPRLKPKAAGCERQNLLDTVSGRDHSPVSQEAAHGCFLLRNPLVVVYLLLFFSAFKCFCFCLFGLFFLFRSDVWMMLLWFWGVRFFASCSF